MQAHDDHVIPVHTLTDDPRFEYHDIGDGIRFNTRTLPDGRKLVTDGNTWRLSLGDKRFSYEHHGPATYGHVSEYYLG